MLRVLFTALVRARCRLFHFRRWQLSSFLDCVVTAKCGRCGAVQVCGKLPSALPTVEVLSRPNPFLRDKPWVGQV